MTKKKTFVKIVIKRKLIPVASLYERKKQVQLFTLLENLMSFIHSCLFASSFAINDKKWKFEMCFIILVTAQKIGRYVKNCFKPNWIWKNVVKDQFFFHFCLTSIKVLRAWVFSYKYIKKSHQICNIQGLFDLSFYRKHIYF